MNNLFVIALLLVVGLPYVYSQHNVAIIGGGIGGGSCAYHLRKFFPAINITVFESNGYIGGRLKHFTLDGDVYELGGDAWATPNLVMQQLASEMKVNVTVGSKRKTVGDSGIGIWLGKNNWTSVDESPSRDSLELLYAMFAFRLNLSDDYSQYFRNNNKSFDTPQSFFRPFSVGVERKMKDFLSSLGISEPFSLIDIIPIIRAIYDQEDEVNAFAGMASLVPLFADSYSVTNGNSKLVEALFKASKAEVRIQSTVSSVTKLRPKAYQIYVQNPNNKLEQSIKYDDVYDAVFVATPLESAQELTFSGIPKFNFTMREYRHWYVTFVVADGLNSTYFGINPVPDEILTTRGGESFSPFVVLSLRGITSQGKKVYKTFSNAPLDSFIDLMYLNATKTVVQYWPKTFPILTLSEYQPFQLDDYIYYINTMESSATAMESSALGGRNVAMMYYEQVYKSS